MHKLTIPVIGFIIGLASLLIIWSTASQIQDNGDFIFEIKKPESEKYLKFYNSFLTNGPQLATFINSQFNFPQNVYFIIDECNEPTPIPAYYNGRKTIEVCYVFFDENYTFTKEVDPSIGKNGALELFNGLIVFTFSHEIAHALIDIYDLPVVGNEEIAADQLATMILLQLMIQDGSVSYYLSGPMVYFAQETSSYPDVNSIPYSSKYPLGEQRSSTILCLAYGKLGEKPFSEIDIEDYLSSERISNCPSEFVTVSNNWVELLQNYLKSNSTFRIIAVKHY